MICQRCGKLIPPKDIVVCEFKGRKDPNLHTRHIACESCAYGLYIDLLKKFPENMVDELLNCYYLIEREVGDDNA